MSQSIDGLPPAHTGNLTCVYTSRMSALQIVRISNIEEWYFERVIFPGQTIMFSAPAEAVLEIYSGSYATCLLADCIPCTQLQMREAPVQVVAEE